jgi:hypothetical protein
MANFQDFLNILNVELVAFAEYSWKTYKTQAVKDGKFFVEQTKQDMERWTKMLATRDLTRDDFEWLMVSKRELAALTALKQKGLAKVALDRFTNGLIDTIVSTAFKVFL